MLEKRLFPAIEISDEEKIRLSRLKKSIDALFEVGKIDEAEKLKADSVKRLTILYGHWVCNFKCPNYCYTKGTGDGILTSAQTKEVIKQAMEMGAKVTYWPGEGEVTLLEDFWGVMDWQAEQKLPAVLFTNGSIFHNDELSKKVLGITSDELITKLNEKYPQLHLYVKFWNSSQVKASEMVGVNEEEYPYAAVKGRSVPLALAKLLQGIGKERLGAEVMVSKENYEDVVTNILPTINELGIYGYTEPVIFSGNAKSRQKEQALSNEQRKYLAGIFASGGDYCKKRQSVELIVKGSILTPGIAIPPRVEDKVVSESGNVKDLFAIFHNEYFRKMREKSEELNGCLCRAYLDGKI